MKGYPPTILCTQQGTQIPLQPCMSGNQPCCYSLVGVESDLFDDLAVNFVMQILLLLAQLHSKRRRQHQGGEENIREVPAHLHALPLPTLEFCQEISDSRYGFKFRLHNFCSVVLYRPKEGRLYSHSDCDA